MLRCNKCGLNKEESDFNFNKSTGRYACHCRKCHSAYLKQNYKENKARYKANAKKRQREIRDWYNDYKSKLFCKNCGENHPGCLDFHHKDRDVKEKEISQAMGSGWSVEKLLEEMAKCDVLCSNCHRKLHSKFEMKEPEYYI